MPTLSNAATAIAPALVVATAGLLALGCPARVVCPEGTESRDDRCYLVTSAWSDVAVPELPSADASPQADAADGVTAPGSDAADAGSVLDMPTDIPSELPDDATSVVSDSAVGGQTDTPSPLPDAETNDAAG